MADALQRLSAEMLESGTARWGAYDQAGLINANDRWSPDPSRINAHTEGIVHTPLDRAAAEHGSAAASLRQRLTSQRATQRQKRQKSAAAASVFPAQINP